MPQFNEVTDPQTIVGPPSPRYRGKTGLPVVTTLSGVGRATPLFLITSFPPQTAFSIAQLFHLRMVLPVCFAAIAKRGKCSSIAARVKMALIGKFPF